MAYGHAGRALVRGEGQGQGQKEMRDGSSSVPLTARRVAGSVMSLLMQWPCNPSLHDVVAWLPAVMPVPDASLLVTLAVLPTSRLHNHTQTHVHTRLGSWPPHVA